MSRKDCPAMNLRCNHCGILGHFRAVCEKNKREKVQSRSNAIEEEQHDYLKDHKTNADATFAFSYMSPQDFWLPNMYRRYAPPQEAELSRIIPNIYTTQDNSTSQYC